MKYIDWFRKLLKEIPDSAPTELELFYVSIKLDERDFIDFSIEVEKYSNSGNGGIMRTYNGDSNQDLIEVQIGRTYFTVYKKLYREDPFRYRGKCYEAPTKP